MDQHVKAHPPKRRMLVKSPTLAFKNIGHGFSSNYS